MFMAAKVQMISESSNHLENYPFCLSMSKNDMVPFGRNPKSALSEQRSSDQQMGGEEQVECRPRRVSDDVNDVVHVHFCFINCLYLIQYIGLAHHKTEAAEHIFRDVSADIILWKWKSEGRLQVFCHELCGGEYFYG